MSVSQYKKYLWLVDTIRSAGKITKEEIDRKWCNSSLNENHDHEIPESTYQYLKSLDIEEI